MQVYERMGGILYMCVSAQFVSGLTYLSDNFVVVFFFFLAELTCQNHNSAVNSALQLILDWVVPPYPLLYYLTFIAHHGFAIHTWFLHLS